MRVVLETAWCGAASLAQNRCDQEAAEEQWERQSQAEWTEAQEKFSGGRAGGERKRGGTATERRSELGVVKSESVAR